MTFGNVALVGNGAGVSDVRLSPGGSAGIGAGESDCKNGPGVEAPEGFAAVSAGAPVSAWQFTQRETRAAFRKSQLGQMTPSCWVRSADMAISKHGIVGEKSRFCKEKRAFNRTLPRFDGAATIEGH
jgi:hypothetical protein